MTVYATLDTRGNNIVEYAAIKAFASVDKAHAYLLSGYDSFEWDVSTAEIGPGCFSDCWKKASGVPIKDHGKLYAGHLSFEPFTADDLNVQPRDGHLDGKPFWVTPMPEVLTVWSIRKANNG